MSSGMLIPPGPVRVMMATKPVDFRKGANGLAALVREQLRADPFCRHDLVLPLQAGRPREARVLGRHGAVPVCKAS